MFRIRYYDKMLHPDHFKRGLLGRCIISLNWVRWKLETFIQRLVLKFLARHDGVSKTEESRFREIFLLDVEAEALQKKQTSPLLPLRRDEETQPRASRYEGGRFKHLAENTIATEENEQLPNRPIPIDDLIARHGVAPPRARRYAKGRVRFTMREEGDFESVPKATGKLVSIGNRS